MKGQGNLSFMYLKGPFIKIFRVDNNTDFWLTSLQEYCSPLISFCHKLHFKGLEKGCSISRYVKGVPFCNERYTKGLRFRSKMVYKRVRRWTSGQSLPV